MIGAGLYARDWPGTCHSDEVSAAALAADPSPETLREFVRCAAMIVESRGYFAKEELEDQSALGPRRELRLRAGHDGQPGHVRQRGPSERERTT